MGLSAIILPLAAAAAAATAGHITPSGAEVPANLLRIEVHFDRTMPALAAGAIVLRDGAGKAVDDALLDIVLPDGDERNLVVLMQPGRIKQGVGPNLALGPALREGERISIEVRDPRLARPLSRSWRVAAPATSALAPAQWRVQTPAAGGKTPLLLVLPTAINGDAATLIGVAGADGRRIAGDAQLVAGETQWRFVPAAPWQPGSYQVRIHPALEDPAGNRICAAFEERLQSRRDCSAGARIAFSVGAP